MPAPSGAAAGRPGDQQPSQCTCVCSLIYLTIPPPVYPFANTVALENTQACYSVESVLTRRERAQFIAIYCNAFVPQFPMRSLALFPCGSGACSHTEMSKASSPSLCGRPSSFKVEDPEQTVDSRMNFQRISAGESPEGEIGK